MKLHGSSASVEEHSRCVLLRVFCGIEMVFGLLLWADPGDFPGVQWKKEILERAAGRFRLALQLFGRIDIAKSDYLALSQKQWLHPWLSFRACSTTFTAEDLGTVMLGEHGGTRVFIMVGLHARYCGGTTGLLDPFHRRQSHWCLNSGTKWMSCTPVAQFNHLFMQVQASESLTTHDNFPVD